MTDDEILETLDARFAGVETRLPPTRLSSGGEALVLAPRAGSSVGGSGALLALLAAVAVIATLAVVGRSSLPGVIAESTGGPSTSSTSPSPSAPPTHSLSPSHEPTLLVLRGSTDGDSILIEHFGWGPTLCGRDAAMVGLPGASVDDAIDRSGTEEGWVEVPLPGTGKASSIRVWIGPTIEPAAIAYGASVLAIGGRGDTWIVVGAGARQIVSFATPKGRTFWLLTAGVSDGPCGVEPH